MRWVHVQVNAGEVAWRHRWGDGWGAGVSAAETERVCARVDADICKECCGPRDAAARERELIQMMVVCEGNGERCVCNVCDVAKNVRSDRVYMYRRARFVNVA